MKLLYSVCLYMAITLTANAQDSLLTKIPVKQPRNTNMQLTPILKKLEHFFISQHSIAGSRLQDGISKAEIEQKIAPLNLTLPPEIFELFEWKNGMRDSTGLTLGDSWIFPLGRFEPFDSCLSAYKISVNKGYYDRKFFPVFTSGGGDDLVVNCDPADSLYGYVYMHSFVLSIPDGMSINYQSLESLLQCTLDCYEAGAYSFVNGVLEINDELADPIEAKYFIEEEEDLTTTAPEKTISGTTLLKELFTSYKDSIVFSIPEERKFGNLIFSKVIRMQLPICLEGYQLQEKNIVFMYPNDQYLIICLDVNGNQPPGEWTYDGKKQDNLLTMSYPGANGKETASNQQRVNQLFIKQFDIVGLMNIRPDNYELFHRCTETYRVE